METEQARHETEESLILSQFGTSRNIPHKLQNGGQSSESDSLENAGDTNWNHYKSSAGANSMKRHRKNCNSPASVQGLFDQGPYTMNGELMNGELKHALNEQSLMTHQPKKLKVDSEMRGNDDITSSLVDSFPELTKATQFERNSPQTEIKLDNRNFIFPNGDIFGLPRNKQGSIPNGAESPPSNIEGTPGDLLEKTLSQYYPEQVSIAPQTSGQQIDAVNGSLTNKLPSESSQPPLTSGMPNLAQMPDSQQQRPVASSNVEGGNNYNSVNFVVNGYSNHFEADHRQQQQQQQQQQQPLLAALKVARQIEMAAKARQEQQQQQNYAMNGIPMSHPRMMGPMQGQMQMMQGPRGPQVMQAMQQGQWGPGMQNQPVHQPQVPPQQVTMAPQQPQGAPMPQQAQLMQRPMMPQQQGLQMPGVMTPQGPSQQQGMTPQQLGMPRGIPGNIAPSALQELLRTLKSPSSPLSLIHI